mgnify:FL=1
MPIATLKYATAYVPLRAAPRKGFLNATSPTSRLNARSPAEVTGTPNRVKPKAHRAKLTIKGRRSSLDEVPIDAFSGFKFEHRSQEANVCKEAWPAREKMGPSEANPRRRPLECPMKTIDCRLQQGRIELADACNADLPYEGKCHTSYATRYAHRSKQPDCP